MVADSDSATDGEIPAPTETVGVSENKFWRMVHSGEDLLLAVALTGILVVPLLEMVLRSFFESGLVGGNALTQHFTLFVSMLGGAVAARQARLLTLSQGFAWLPSPWGKICEVWRVGIATGVCVLLAWASWRFLLFEKEGGKVIAYGVPVWVALIALAGGFAIVALRLVRHVGTDWWMRAAAVAVAAAIGWYVLHYSVEPDTWTPAFVLLVGVDQWSARGPDLYAIGRCGGVFVLGVVEPVGVRGAFALQSVDQPDDSSAAAVHVGGLFLSRRWHVGSDGSATESADWRHAGGAGDCHGDGVCILHVAYRGLGRDDFGPRRTHCAVSDRGAL